MTPKPVSNKSAWVQLYEARRTGSEVKSRPPGRPPAIIPRRKIGLTLSQGETQELDAWQGRLSALMHRKVSLGETVGIMTRICSARHSRLGEKANVSTLADLVEKMIG